MNSLLSVNKWRIFLQVLPFSLLFCFAKWSFHQIGWEPWKFDSFTGALFGTSTFVLALVLSETLSDYRSSEDLPPLLINSFESIQDSNLLAAAIYPGYNPLPLQSAIAEVNQALLLWLLQQQSIENVYRGLDKLNQSFVALEKVGGTAWINRTQGEQAKIRLLIARIKENRDSDFLGPAYVMLFIFLFASVIALLLIGAESFSENLTIAGFIFTSFCYLFLLIRDLDNPFQYDGTSSIDVNLSELKLFNDRVCNS